MSGGLGVLVTVRPAARRASALGVGWLLVVLTVVRLVIGDAVAEITRLKAEDGGPMGIGGATLAGRPCGPG